MPKNVNLFIHVVDNLWDIGFAAELVRSFNEVYPSEYFFDIWTDTVEKVSSFFEKNPELEGSYAIRGIKNIEEKKASISFLLFHHRVPENYPYSERELFLRIDYLSFDPEWVGHHGKEHLDSTEKRKIIEIIPSPLPESGWLIPPTRHLIGRNELAKKYGLDRGKKWVTIFAYRETLLENLKIEGIKDAQILLLGADPSQAQDDKETIHLPFLSLTEFSSVIHESAWAIIRGEVSLISTLQLGTPFLWDMYKEMGGFYPEQAEQFLDWTNADSDYREIFYRLNGQIEKKVILREVGWYFQNHPVGRNTESWNLVEELQKYIDKYHFSL